MIKYWKGLKIDSELKRKVDLLDEGDWLSEHARSTKKMMILL